MTSTSTRTDRLRFGVLCTLAYIAASWAVRYDLRLGGQIASLVYPLDTFSMYGRPPGADTSVLLVRDARGEVFRVTDFRAFDCAEPVSGPAAQCARTRGIPYHYADLARYVEQHRGAGDVEVDLITRTWRVAPGAPVEVLADCVVAHCRAAR